MDVEACDEPVSNKRLALLPAREAHRAEWTLPRYLRRIAVSFASSHMMCDVMWRHISISFRDVFTSAVIWASTYLCSKDTLRPQVLCRELAAILHRCGGSRITFDMASSENWIWISNLSPTRSLLAECGVALFWYGGVRGASSVCADPLVQSGRATGLNVLAKNRRNWQVNFIDSGLEVAKTRFQTFLRGKSVLFKWKCQIREFHAHGMERGDSEVLKRYCGWQKEATLLKQTSKDRTFIHAAGALQ